MVSLTANLISYLPSPSMLKGKVPTNFNKYNDTRRENEHMIANNGMEKIEQEYLCYLH